jgi:hypothetical protein
VRNSTSDKDLGSSISSRNSLGSSRPFNSPIEKRDDLAGTFRSHSREQLDYSLDSSVVAGVSRIRSRGAELGTHRQLHSRGSNGRTLPSPSTQRSELQSRGSGRPTTSHSTSMGSTLHPPSSPLPVGSPRCTCVRVYARVDVRRWLSCAASQLDGISSALQLHDNGNGGTSGKLHPLLRDQSTAKIQLNRVYTTMMGVDTLMVQLTHLFNSDAMQTKQQHDAATVMQVGNLRLAGRGCHVVPVPMRVV